MLYEMLGNVWERIADWYDPEFYHTSAMLDLKGSASAKHKVLRGAFWFHFFISSAPNSDGGMCPLSRQQRRRAVSVAINRVQAISPDRQIVG
jgi:formylglycine-generating enzyme required for sulfatase activity